MSELMMQGVNLALVGMGVVFTFLAVLVWLTTLMSGLVARYPAPDAALGAVGGEPRRSGTTGSPEDAPDNQRLVAIISAAIRQHRNRN